MDNLLMESSEPGTLHVSWDALPEAENGYCIQWENRGTPGNYETSEVFTTADTSYDLEIDKPGDYYVSVWPAETDYYKDGQPARNNLQFFEVSFDATGGSSVSSQIVAEDGLATEPAAPQKEGYAFVDWCTLAGTPWDFGADRVTENVTLEAQWSDDVSYLVRHYQENPGGAGGYALTAEEQFSGRNGQRTLDSSYPPETCQEFAHMRIAARRLALMRAYFAHMRAAERRQALMRARCLAPATILDR